jgi:hypothetical protein
MSSCCKHHFHSYDNLLIFLTWLYATLLLYSRYLCVGVNLDTRRLVEKLVHVTVINLDILVAVDDLALLHLFLHEAVGLFLQQVSAWRPVP